MGRWLHTSLDLLHPDTSSKVLEKQDKLIRNKPFHKFEIGDTLFARTFMEQNGYLLMLQKSLDHFHMRYKQTLAFS